MNDGTILTVDDPHIVDDMDTGLTKFCDEILAVGVSPADIVAALLAQAVSVMAKGGMNEMQQSNELLRYANIARDSAFGADRH